MLAKFDKVSASILKVTNKYRNHPSVFRIKELCRGKSKFYSVGREQIQKQIIKIGTSKVF